MIGRLLSAGVVLLLGCGASSAEVQARTAQDAAAETKKAETTAKVQAEELEALRSELAFSEPEAVLPPPRTSQPAKRSRRIVEEPLSEHGFEEQLEEPAELAPEADRPMLTLYGDQAPTSDLIAASGDGSDATIIGGAPTPEGYYRSGLELIQQKKFARALAVFREFSKLYPDHGYADNAVFWMGEIHFLQRRYSKALEEYKRLIKVHPGGNKIPDALYKMGIIYQERGEPGTAKKYFRQLQKRFPHSAAARLASQEGGT